MVTLNSGARVMVSRGGQVLIEGVDCEAERLEAVSQG